MNYHALPVETLNYTIVCLLRKRIADVMLDIMNYLMNLFANVINIFFTIILRMSLNLL